MTIGIYASNNGGEYGKINAELMKIAKNYPTILQIHGFYVDKKIKTISFDIIFDFEEQHPEKILKEIKKKLKEKYPQYEYMAIIDSDISE